MNYHQERLGHSKEICIKSYLAFERITLVSCATSLHTFMYVKKLQLIILLQLVTAE